MNQSQDSLETKKDKTTIRAEIRARTVGYILTALGLVAGLAWNDAIAAAIQHFFPLGRDTVVAKSGYAAIITIVVVAVSVAIAKWIEGKKSQD
ncbi:MAG: DUF5654 family protein [Patescibacteria group bacterium]